MLRNGKAARWSNVTPICRDGDIRRGYGQISAELQETSGSATLVMQLEDLPAYLNKKNDPGRKGKNDRARAAGQVQPGKVQPGKTRPMNEASMPRYFFNLFDGRKIVPDPVGTELSDFHSARTHAFRVMRELAKHREEQTKAWRLVVYEEHGAPCFELAFASGEDAFRYPPRCA
jgi:hypothetical protein